MGNVAHTPGPWNHERMLITKATKDRRSGFVVNGPLPDDALEFPVRVCDLRVPAGMDGFAEGAANARLIAAAPELLDLLCRALPFVEDAQDNDAYKPSRLRAFIGEIRAAIAKVEGNA